MTSRLLGAVFEAARRRRAVRDPEDEMIRNRVFFSLAIFTYLTVTGATRVWQLRWGAAIYIALGIVFLAHSLIWTAPSPARRLISIVADLGALCYMLHLGRETTQIFYPLYLWIIFGNGFRFGNKYLFATMLLGLAGFAAVIATTPFWQQHRMLSLGLLIGLLILPLYTSTLIRKLSQAKQEAEEANQAKSLLLAGVSHELRTPLNAIIGMGHLLQDSRLDSEQKQMTRTIAAAGKSLLSLIDALLDLSRIEAGRMSVKVDDFDLLALLSEVRDVVAAQARAKKLRVGLHVTTRTPALLRGDRRHLHAILLNLAGNAVKFTEQGTVAFTIDAVQQSDSGVRVRFEVSDTGIGIAPDAIGRIFDHFTQADESITQRYGGTGLGLAICKRLVELMGGEIGVTSEPGVGSTFWFTLELGRQAAAASSARPLPREVILLSSDPTLSEQVTALLAGMGVTAVRAASARGALPPPGEAHARDAPILVAGSGAEAEVAAMLGQSFADPPPLIRVGPQQPGDGLPPAEQRRVFVTELSPTFAEAELRAALAIAAAGREIAPEPVAAPAPARKLRILVADDNRTNQQVIAKVLERAGHESEIVANGEQALDALDKSSFDLVLMDVNMPLMNGIEATKLYRFASLGQKHVPILALTADATPAAAKRCIEAGMDACVTKPVQPARLLEMIDKLVSGEPAVPPAAPADGERVRDITTHPRFRLASAPVLDERALADLEALGGRDFVIDLIDDFVADAEHLVGELIAAAREVDVQKFRSQAHALRSAAANVGAKSLFELCLATRLIQTRELREQGDSLIARLANELKRLHRALLEYRSGLQKAEQQH